MEKGFWAVPKSIAKSKDLSLRAKLVAGILWTRKNSDFQAFPSRNYMAQALGISTKTVDRGIEELKEKANLTVERKGLKRNNRYFLPDWDKDESPELSTSEKTSLSNQELPELPTPIVRESNKDNTVVESNDSSVKEIFSYFASKVEVTKGFDPEISWAKDGKLTKLRLQKYSKEEIKKLIDWYLSSRFSERLGVSLSTCLSAYIINLYKSEMASQPHYPVWKPH
jgi:DNA-binding transcriptional regulator YhcF (GntR family)